MDGQTICSRPIKAQVFPPISLFLEVHKLPIQMMTIWASSLVGKHRSVLHSNLRAGCIAEARTRVELVRPNPNPPPRGVENSEVYPCFDHQTIPDILPAGVSWRYYTPSAGSIWTAPNAISHICQPTGPGGTCQGREWLNHVDPPGGCAGRHQKL